MALLKLLETIKIADQILGILHVQWQTSSYNLDAVIFSDNISGLGASSALWLGTLHAGGEWNEVWKNICKI